MTSLSRHEFLQTLTTVSAAGTGRDSNNGAGTTRIISSQQPVTPKN
jgi:hypothetical protein